MVLCGSHLSPFAGSGLALSLLRHRITRSGACELTGARCQLLYATTRHNHDGIVERDFEYIRGWCNDEWHWVGYQTEIESPDGETLDDEDSCWGYEGNDDGTKYMVGEAQSNAQGMIDRHRKEVAKEKREAKLMACRDIATV